MNDEIRHYRDEVLRSRDMVERQVSEQKAHWLEEKTNMQIRVDELEKELENLHQKVVAMINSYKKVRVECNGTCLIEDTNDDAVYSYLMSASHTDYLRW